MQDRPIRLAEVFGNEVTADEERTGALHSTRKTHTSGSYFLSSTVVGWARISVYPNSQRETTPLHGQPCAALRLQSGAQTSFSNSE
jgi:hypothetical protein